ncbi:MAG: KAP family NTPase [Bacteroidales bacterium]|nr:KAP family NTPase [Candidatus Latescibacterota bacterium]
MSKKVMGIVDEPNPRYAKDCLGIERHASALSQFVLRANTPLTIGIQGEWGSGKTSLLNSIHSTLEESGTCRQIWVNAWEHSLLVNPEEALLRIASEIIQEMLVTDGDANRSAQVKNAAKGIFRGALRVGATAALGVKAGDITDELFAEQSPSIKALREQLAKIACEIQERPTNPFQKFVVYVDDLDRIEPHAAVTILELLKNIFSVPNCIFILAVDYQVVVKGLESKFGKRTEENEWEFRAFFDKIIQLPFMMPMGQYDIGKYVGDLLQKVGFDSKARLNEADLHKIIALTIGGNPRSLKRMVNSLSLIEVFIGTADAENQDTMDELDRLMLFALVCLQISFPDLYDLVNSYPDFLEWTEDVAAETTRRKEEHDHQFSQMFEIATSTGDFDEIWEQVVFRVCYANPRQRVRARDASQFFNLLRDRFSSKKGVSLPERITRTLDYTSVTSMTTSDKTQTRKSDKDFSKYKFGGRELGKSRLVLAVLSQYVADNPDVSFDDLKANFPDEAQGAIGVFVKKEEAEDRFARTGYKRFFMKTNEPIMLIDGPVCVCNQWGKGNVEKFIAIARKLGVTIS